ncbi:hypothetical protein Glove_627g56 [Diversispora epigaea]|uniref:Uncharacterized protein n=1 Tax=Diversispora epigaea TaxID=1348612 RepID=A0A397G5M2_9GLOM|nr:hypothetical protein Glove_627g56 [Diversispora epigaea]
MTIPPRKMISMIPIVKTLMKIDRIAQYKIPIKSNFKKEEWLKLECEWQKVEKMVAPENSELDEYQENLLKKYDNTIKKTTIGYSVSLGEIRQNCASPYRKYFSEHKQSDLDEVKNSDRKVQKDSSRLPGIQHATVMKVKSIEFQVGFGEVVRNVCEHDNARIEWDREKILKYK